MSKINIIYKSDVFFNFFEPTLVKKELTPYSAEQMHHGDIYIYFNKIILQAHNRWFRANIQDIQKIKTVIPRKQIIISFGCFDMVLYCKDLIKLLAIRDFLNLSKSYLEEKSSKYSESRILVGNSLNSRNH